MVPNPAQVATASRGPDCTMCTELDSMDLSLKLDGRLKVRTGGELFNFPFPGFREVQYSVLKDYTTKESLP